MSLPDWDEQEFLAFYRGLPAAERQQLHRLLLRMVNNSELVSRLADSFEKGQLSARDLLRIGGK